MEKLRLQLGCRGGDDAQCEALKVFCLHAAGFDLYWMSSMGCRRWAKPQSLCVLSKLRIFEGADGAGMDQQQLVWVWLNMNQETFTKGDAGIPWFPKQVGHPSCRLVRCFVGAERPSACLGKACLLCWFQWRLATRGWYRFLLASTSTLQNSSMVLDSTRYPFPRGLGFDWKYEDVHKSNDPVTCWKIGWLSNWFCIFPFRVEV